MENENKKIKANIVNNNLVFTPFDDNLPIIELTENEYLKVKNGELSLVNGVLTDCTTTLKQLRHEDAIVSLIRKKYNVNQELAILRQRDTKPIEYQEYFDYVEQCKAEVKLGG